MDITAYFWSYGHNEFSEKQLEKWDLTIGEPIYVVPSLGLFTRNPIVEGCTDVKTFSTAESDAAGKKILEGETK